MQPTGLWLGGSVRGGLTREGFRDGRAIRPWPSLSSVLRLQNGLDGSSKRDYENLSPLKVSEITRSSAHPGERDYENLSHPPFEWCSKRDHEDLSKLKVAKSRRYPPTPESEITKISAIPPRQTDSWNGPMLHRNQSVNTRASRLETVASWSEHRSWPVKTEASRC